MKLIRFMNQETVVSKRRILLLAGISGIANSLLLVILNQAATQLQDGAIEAQLFMQYLLTFTLFIFAQRTSQREAVTAVETALQSFRVRLADKVRRTELRTIEEIGDIGNYSPLTQGANTIAQSAMYMVTGVESLLVLVFASLYLLWLSPPSFLAASLLIGIAIPLFVRHYHRTFQELSEASRKEGVFFERFTALLRGFKQLKVNRQESDDLFADIKQLANETSELKCRSNVRLMEDILLSNVTFYLLLMVVVFILPSLIVAHEENLFQVIATVLFMMEPVSMIAAALPNVSKTNVAVSSLYRLEDRLDEALDKAAAQQSAQSSPSSPPSTQPGQPQSTPADNALSPDFSRIRLQALSFAYQDQQGNSLFDAGPFSLSCQRGETVFITGGNGSGKSTLLKLICGLYHPQAGHIQLDERVLTRADYPAYRELFSVVFNDFHLFERLYGVSAAQADEINHWLEKMSLAQKTQFVDGRFTQTHLSTGHRKRLAFIAAVVQHRPVLILDELAADQDPTFRRHFYTNILPELKQQGKTIIAVTHDDAYFALADRVLQMEAGQLEEQAG